MMKSKAVLHPLDVARREGRKAADLPPFDSHTFSTFSFPPLLLYCFIFYHVCFLSCMINPSLDSYIGYVESYLAQLKLIRWNQQVTAHQYLIQRGFDPRYPSSTTGQSFSQPYPLLNPFVANQVPVQNQVNLWNRPPRQFPPVDNRNEPKPEPVIQDPKQFKQFPVVGNWNSLAPSEGEPFRPPSSLRLPPADAMGDKDENPELESMRKILRSLAIPFPDGIPLGRLNNEYKELEGRDIPYHEFGHQTLQSFIRKDMASTLYFGCDKLGTTVVKAYMDEDTAHVQQLVHGQKKVSKKRRPAVVSRPMFNAR